MKIFFFSPVFPYPPNRDGMSIIAYHVLRRLSRNHDVRLVCFGAESDRSHTSELGVRDVVIIPTPRHSLSRHLISSFLTLRPWYAARMYSSKMKQEIELTDLDPLVDAVILHSPFLAEYLPLVRQKPVIVVAIDALSKWFADVAKKERNPFKRLHLQREARCAASVEATMYPKARQVVVVTNEDRDALAKHMSRMSISVIPNGVDNIFFQPTPKEPQPMTLVTTGSMDYPPNVDGVVWFAQEVWPALAQRYPTLRWFIVGRNPSPAVQRVGRDARIIVTGAVPDLRPFLSQGTVYVAPIFSGAGIKNKVLEALSMGSAVVATPESFQGIPSEPGIHYLAAKAPREFAEHIDRVLNDTMLRSRLGATARELALHMSWEKRADEYAELINRMISNRHG